MKVALVQFVPWDKSYYFSADEVPAAFGDRVIVKTELGTELGLVTAVYDLSEREIRTKLSRKAKTAQAQADGDGAPAEESAAEVKPILRRASAADLEKMASPEERARGLEFAKRLRERLNLPMKLVDAYFAYDGSRVTFAFIADGRVDFREMVKELTRHFNRSIRLQQIGIRDEARIAGDLGHCGRNLCCRGHLKELSSISSDMAETQQCSHRGSDRISGVCGRLMCCLAYEQKGYEELRKKFPPVGARVNVDGQRGTVVGYHVLKETVDVEFPPVGEKDRPVVLEIDLNRHKK